jgi:hypothetical protein
MEDERLPGTNDALVVEDHDLVQEREQ